jgi:hypothetical protein
VDGIESSIPPPPPPPDDSSDDDGGIGLNRFRGGNSSFMQFVFAPLLWNWIERLQFLVRK